MSGILGLILGILDAGVSKETRAYSRQLRLTNTVAILLAVIIFIYSIGFWFAGQVTLAILAAPFIIAYGMIPYVNYRGLTNLGRWLMIFYGNFVVWEFSSLLGRDANAQSFFYLLICYPFLFFLFEEKTKIVLSYLTTFLFFTLSWSVDLSQVLEIPSSQDFRESLSILFDYTSLFIVSVIVFVFFYQNTMAEKDLANSHREVVSMQSKLVQSAHFAGMAEVSVGLIHNIGNSLTSIKVSSGLIDEAAQIGYRKRFELLAKELEKYEVPEALGEYTRQLGFHVDNQLDLIEKHNKRVVKTCQLVANTVKAHQEFAKYREGSEATQIKPFWKNLSSCPMLWRQQKMWPLI